MLESVYGLGSSFLFGFLLGVAVFLAGNRQKISTAISALWALRGSGSSEKASGLLGQVQEMAGQIFESLAPKPSNFVSLCCVGPALSDTFEVELPWCTLEASPRDCATFAVTSGSKRTSSRLKDGHPSAAPLHQALEDALQALPEGDGASHLLMCGEGALFGSKTRVIFPWGDAELDLQQVVGVPVSRAEKGGELRQNGPIILFRR